MKREQTTKEREADRAAKRAEERAGRARIGLLDLQVAMQRLSNSPKMGKVVGQLQEHMAWLIAEDESYQQAAAELYVGGVRVGGEDCGAQASGRDVRD